jgi:hypothetical protein
MRNLVVASLLLLGIAIPQFARADNPNTGQLSLTAAGATDGSQLRALLKSFDLNLIAKAYAAECKDEGEICKTNADCCSGLECSGDPQATCRPEE